MKTTKTFILGALLIMTALFSVNAYSQECEYEVNEVDKFTNKKKIITVAVPVVKKFEIKKLITIKPISFQLKYVEEQYLLNLLFNMKWGNVTPTDKDKLILILANGEQVQLIRASFYPSEMTGKATSAVLGYEYIITPEQLQQLQQSDITDVRVEATINPFDFQVDENVSTKDIFNCLE